MIYSVYFYLRPKPRTFEQASFAITSFSAVVCLLGLCPTRQVCRPRRQATAEKEVIANDACFVVLPPLSGFCEREKEGVQRVTSTSASVRLTTIPKRAKKCRNLLLVLLSIMVAAAAAAATRARLGSGFCTQAVSPTLLWERGWLARLRSVDGQTSLFARSKSATQPSRSQGAWESVLRT